jgi:3-oxoadipate enol-lactonase
MPTIEVPGAVVAYQDTGAPDGKPDAPTVVFGHGLLFGGWMFRAQVAALQGRYRCVTIDWRGQGASPAARHGYDMESLTSDAVALINRLGIAPVHWVGLSMGGFVGQRLAARHGELIRSLTLLDTSADAEEPAKVRERERLALFQLFFGITPVLGKVKPLLFGSRFLADRDSDELIGEWLGRLRKTRRAGLRKAVLGVARRTSVAAELGGITARALIVVGADDRATPPEHSRRIATGIPGSRLRVVPDCGHSSTLEQPDAISNLLTEFLGEVDQADQREAAAVNVAPGDNAAAARP